MTDTGHHRSRRRWPRLALAGLVAVAAVAVFALVGLLPTCGDGSEVGGAEPGMQQGIER